MNRFLVAMIILCSLLVCCETRKEPEQDKPRHGIDTVFPSLDKRSPEKYMQSLINNDSTILDQMGKGDILSGFYSELMDSLKRTKIPPFFYNECLDEDNMTYCTVSLHEYRSLRKDLIDMLDEETLASITNIAVPNLLNRTCTDKTLANILPYYNVSTWELIKSKK
jgi:hypothetical protein